MFLLPNGYLAAGNVVGNIEIQNTEYGGLIKTFTGHNDRISALAVLYNGFLASGSQDRKIKIWNIDTGSAEINRLLQSC